MNIDDSAAFSKKMSGEGDQCWVGPEWCRSASLDLKEEDRVNWVNCLYKVFAEQKMTDREGWAGANPGLGILSVFLIEWKGDCCFQGHFPFVFECLAPG